MVDIKKILVENYQLKINDYSIVLPEEGIIIEHYKKISMDRPEKEEQ